MAVIFKNMQNKKSLIKKPPVEVWTGKIGKSYPGIITLDVSVKTGTKVFAPTWDMVRSYKGGSLSDHGYALLYHGLMGKSKILYPNTWADILARREVILLCYCKSGDFCHRTLLANMFESMGAVNNGEY